MRNYVAMLLLGSTLLLGATLPGCKGGGGGEGDPEDTTSLPPEPTTSVLLITLDTTRADRLGCYGNTLGATPNLDTLAADGVVFRRAFCHTPLTIPSHATILTGQYPDHHGVRDNGDAFLSEEAVTLAERFQAAGYPTGAAVAAYVTNHKWGFAQGFDAYFDHIATNYQVSGNTWRSERRGDEVVADLLPWLSEHADEPFFAWLHLFDPHDPYEPPEPYASRYPEQPYLGEVAFMDAQVGVVLDALKESGAWDRTAVVAVGDHGEAFGNHGEYHHGLFVYNATMHVPFVVRPAGGVEPVVIEEPVGLVDVAPTVLALAGLPVEEDVDFDGLDLSAAAKGQEPPHRELYGESLHVRNHYGWSEQRMVVDWPTKYIDSTRPELFDIQADPPEKNDLIESKPEDAGRLSAWIAARDTKPTSATTQELDPDMARRLEALGYVASTVQVDDDQPLPDPKDKIGVLRDTSRAGALLRRRQHKEARTLLEKVVAEEPELIDPRVSLAHACAAVGDRELALDHLAVAEQLNPRSTNVYGLQAAVLVSLGRTDEALAKLDAALEIDPKEARVWDKILQTLFETRQYPEVLTQSERALQEIPEAPFVHGYRGAALVALGQLDAGREELELAIAGGSQPPWAHFAMGVVTDADGDHEASLSHFLTEHGAYPEHIEALASATLQMVRTGHNEEAIEHAALCLSQNTAQPRMYWAEGQALFNLQRYDEAAVSVERCLGLAPDDADCMMLKANVLSRQGLKAEADAAFERAVELAREAHPDAKVEGVRLR